MAANEYYNPSGGSQYPGPQGSPYPPQPHQMAHTPPPPYQLEGQHFQQQPPPNQHYQQGPPPPQQQQQQQQQPPYNSQPGGYGHPQQGAPYPGPQQQYPPQHQDPWHPQPLNHNNGGKEDYSQKPGDPQHYGRSNGPGYPPQQQQPPYPPYPPQQPQQQQQLQPYQGSNRPSQQYLSPAQAGYSSQQRPHSQPARHSRHSPHRHHHSGKHQQRPRSSSNKGTFDTFVGAGGGAFIGDMIFPGLGTVGGALLGGYGGHKVAEEKRKGDHGRRRGHDSDSDDGRRGRR